MKTDSGEGEQGEALECWRHLAVEAAREWQRCRGKPLWRIILEAITESHVVRETVGTNTVTAPFSTVAGAQGKDAASILDAITYAAHELQKCSPLSSAITALDEARKILEKKEADVNAGDATGQKEALH